MFARTGSTRGTGWSWSCINVTTWNHTEATHKMGRRLRRRTRRKRRGKAHAYIKRLSRPSNRRNYRFLASWPKSFAVSFPQLAIQKEPLVSAKKAWCIIIKPPTSGVKIFRRVPYHFGSPEEKDVDLSHRRGEPLRHCQHGRAVARLAPQRVSWAGVHPARRKRSSEVDIPTGA